MKTSICEELKRTLTLAIKRSGLDRPEIANRMSDLLGRHFSVAMLNAYTAQSKEHHKFPAELVPAFCCATGTVDVLVFLAGCCDRVLLPTVEEMRARLEEIGHQLDSLEKERNAILEYLALPVSRGREQI